MTLTGPSLCLSAGSFLPPTEALNVVIERIPGGEPRAGRQPRALACRAKETLCLPHFCAQQHSSVPGGVSRSALCCQCKVHPFPKSAHPLVTNSPLSCPVLQGDWDANEVFETWFSSLSPVSSPACRSNIPSEDVWRDPPPSKSLQCTVALASPVGVGSVEGFELWPCC